MLKHLSYNSEKKNTTSKRQFTPIVKQLELTDLARALITMAILNKHVVDNFTI